MKTPPLPPLRFLLFFGLTGFLAIILWGIYAKAMLFPSVGEGPKLQMTQIERGPILDRDGRLLAVSTRMEMATLWKPQVKDPTALVQALSPILGEDASTLFQRLASGPDFQYLKRKLTAKESVALRELKAKGELSGVHLEPQAGRSYPEGAMAGGLIGYVGVDNIGLAGIEYTFNDVLAPVVVGDTE